MAKSRLRKLTKEKEDLDKRIEATHEYCRIDPEFGILDDAEKVRIQRQLETMSEYSAILHERIKAVTGS